MSSNRVFVFGSNKLGIHGAGAARMARKMHGAILGQGEGLQGNSYGIPTCKHPTGTPNFQIPINCLKEYVERFVQFAREHPELEFQVTQVGCGFAGWNKYQVAPMFRVAPKNCYFDTAWQDVLPENFNFWGTA